MLFHPDRHAALGDTAWDAARAHQALRDIVRDTEQQRLPAGHWPVHPLDDADVTPGSGNKDVYLGTAGVLWALWWLQQAGAVTLESDPVEAIPAVEQAYLAEPDTGRLDLGYTGGLSGILTVLWRLTGAAAAADRLHAAVQANSTHPSNEALSGAPGSMLAAWHLWRATADERWRTLFLANVEQLWQRWVHDEPARCHLWTQVLGGKAVQYIGAGHGWAGNMLPLLKGADLLDDARRALVYERCQQTLRALATVEDGAANWRPGTYTPRPDGPRMLMQWCHGAPGIVTSLADFPAQRSPEMETLLTAAGQAIWLAGPLDKGPGLCHGTAGNGMAFLTLYRRTGDTLWLDRARRFAMHALGQSERQRRAHGQGRHTLWTGDPGVAVFLWHCLQGSAGMPLLDHID